MFRVFLFYESATIALGHRKQVETAFFSLKYIQLCTKIWVVRLKHCDHLLSWGDDIKGRQKMILIKKGRKSKSGVAPATGWQIVDNWQSPGKNQSHCDRNCYCGRTGALTPQPDGKTYKRRLVAQNVFEFKIFWVQNVFELKICFEFKMFFEFKIFLSSKCFWAKMFSGSKCFWAQNVFGLKIFRDPPETDIFAPLRYYCFPDFENVLIWTIDCKM